MPNATVLREVAAQLTDIDEEVAVLRQGRVDAMQKAAKDGWEPKIVREALRRRKRKQFEMFEDEVDQVMAALGE